MGALSTVSVHDGSNWISGSSAGSGGSYSFAPVFIDPTGVALWNTLDSVLDQRFKLTLSVRQPKNGSQVYRVIGKLILPVFDADTPPKSVGTALATVEFVIPKGMAIADRYDLVAILTNWIAGSATTNTSGPVSDVAKAVVNLESVY